MVEIEGSELAETCELVVSIEDVVVVVVSVVVSVSAVVIADGAVEVSAVIVDVSALVSTVTLTDDTTSETVEDSCALATERRATNTKTDSFMVPLFQEDLK